MAVAEEVCVGEEIGWKSWTGKMKLKARLRVFEAGNFHIENKGDTWET